MNFELTPGRVEMLRWEFAKCSEVFQSVYDGTDVESFKCADERDIQGLETSAREACCGVRWPVWLDGRQNKLSNVNLANSAF